jgi:hypothetical protein
VACIRRLGEAAFCLWVLGYVALAEEAYALAHKRHKECSAILQQIQHRADLSLPLGGLAYAARGLGEAREAKRHLCEALHLAVETRAFPPLIEALPVVGLLLADEGEKEQAVELFALASRYPYVASSQWFEDVAGKHIAAVAATLPPDEVSAAQQRGRARDLWETAEKLEGEASDA